MGLSKPKHYRPEVGDEFITLGDIRPSHATRIFEARDVKTGEGILGKLADVNWYMLNGTIAIRFEGETLGFFGVPEERILLKAEGFVMPNADGQPHDSQSGGDRG